MVGQLLSASVAAASSDVVDDILHNDENKLLDRRIRCRCDFGNE